MLLYKKYLLISSSTVPVIFLNIPMTFAWLSPWTSSPLTWEYTVNKHNILVALYNKQNMPDATWLLWYNELFLLRLTVRTSTITKLE